MSEELDNFLKNWPKPAQTIALGDLTLETPKLAICDPVGIALTETSDQAVFIDALFPLGDAKLTVKQWSLGDQSHIAFVIINFSDIDIRSGEVLSWQPAKKAGGPHLFADFDVDYGNVGFMSEEMHASFMSKAAEFGDEAYDEWLWPFIDGEGEDDAGPNEDDAGPNIAEIPLPSGAVFKAATAPGGNGSYDAFIGLDADGTISCVAIDLISPALEMLSRGCTN